MNKPRVSILMATWNRAKKIGPAIESIRMQSFTDWELIIADDGSTDDTPQVVKLWQKKEPRIVYIRSEKNEGISKNYNKGLRIAKGEYIAMIDDDDAWIGKDKLKKEVEFLDRNKAYVGCGGGVVVISDVTSDMKQGTRDGKNRSRELYRYLKPETDGQIRKRMLFSNPMANSTTLFRRDAGESVGWYDETTLYSGDRDFWLKMGLVHIPNPSFVAPHPDFRAKAAKRDDGVAKATSRSDERLAAEKMVARAEYGDSEYVPGRLYNFPEYFSYYTMSDVNTSIAKIRPHLKASLTIMKRYKNNYPHYFLALIFNSIQYWYAFLPDFIKKAIHFPLARLKRRAVG